MNETADNVRLPETPEKTVMTIWPSIGAYRAGRLAGRLSGIQTGRGRFFTLGKVFALATIPVSLVVYFWKLLPLVGRRYRLTNRRVIIEKGFPATTGQAIGLDEFDAVDVEVLAGQDFLHAGDLVFRREGREVFRLGGVARPAVFREICWKTRTAMVSVRDVLRDQASGSAA